MTTRKERALSLVQRGYNVIPIDAGQKRPTFANWQNYAATLERVAEWAARGNIGVLTEHTPVVDLDILDKQLAVEMESFVVGLMGDVPVRVGRAPKRLMVFRTETPFRKLASAFFECEMGVRHRVEVLGKGQQFVAYGIHPDTQQPYQWVSDDALHEVDAADLPVLTVDQAQRIIAEFEKRAEARGWERVGKATEHVDDDEFAFLRPKADVSEDDLRAALDLMPGADQYEVWVKVGAALHDHFDGSETGFEMWDSWSAKAHNYSAEAVEDKWRSFGRYSGRKATVAYILGETKDARAKIKAEKVKSDVADSRARVRQVLADATDGDSLLEAVMPVVAEGNFDDFTTRTLLLEVRDRYKKLAKVTLPVKLLEQQLEAAVSAKKAVNQDELTEQALLLESNVARIVLDRFYSGGNHIMYFSKMWWHYRGGVWLRTEESMVKARVQETVEKLIMERDETTYTIAAMLFESRGDRMSAMVSAILSTMTSMCVREGGDDPLNLGATRVPMAVNTRNCELWFESDGKMVSRKHDSRNCMTSQLETKYDAGSECPTWDAAIRKVFSRCQDPEAVIRHFEEVFGYIIQPTRHQAIWVMLKGPGGNGKSFLLNIICSLMGSRSYVSTSISKIAGTNVSNHFTDSLQGKLMFLDDDVKAGTLLPDDWLKKLSEAKSLSADPKFGGSYNFTARSVPVLLTNKWPSTSDLTDGIRRRAMIFESNHKLTEDEKNPAHMERIIDAELPGVMNRLLDGFRRFLARGSKFDVPNECRESQERWLASSNTTALFASECIEVTGRQEDYVSAQRAYELYGLWIRDHEANAKQLGRNKFYEALKDMGFVMKNHGGSWVFSSVRLRENDFTKDLFG